MWLCKRSEKLNKLKQKTVLLNLGKFLEGFKVLSIDRFKKTNLDEENNSNIQQDFRDEMIEQILNNPDSIDVTKTILHNYSFNPLEI